MNESIIGYSSGNARPSVDQKVAKVYFAAAVATRLERAPNKYPAQANGQQYVAMQAQLRCAKQTEHKYQNQAVDTRKCEVPQARTMAMHKRITGWL